MGKRKNKQSDNKAFLIAVFASFIVLGAILDYLDVILLSIIVISLIFVVTKILLWCITRRRKRLTLKVNEENFISEIGELNWVSEYEQSMRMVDGLREKIEKLSLTRDFIDLTEVQIIKNKEEYLNNIIIEKMNEYEINEQHDIKTKINHLNSLCESFYEKIKNYNEGVAMEKIPHVYDLIGNVEGRRLDDYQMKAIAKEQKSHLVLAGAGSGKTTTIVGKIKYLINSGKSKGDDILILSYTKDAAMEMEERVKKETNIPIDVSTFHKLGMNIIAQTEGRKPNIKGDILPKFIQEQLKKLSESPRYAQILASYFYYGENPFERPLKNIYTVEQYENFLRQNPPTTLKNEKVKSYGEMQVANFLYLNNIEYDYEKEYPNETRTANHSQYKPDFYLPKYDLYIEYYGIDKDGNVPEHWKGKDDKSASQHYRDSIEWKQLLHQEYGTNLIELYAYETFDDSLLLSLKNKLTEFEVDLNKESGENILKKYNQNDKVFFRRFIKLIESIINSIKSNNYTIDQFKKIIISTSKYLDFNMMMITLVEPIFNAYNQYLKEESAVDFNDMIQKATGYVKTGKFIHKYNHVIVDEYQDISKDRYLLLKEMKETKDYSLFCVGDDWQSIYRFSGSDIDYILNFSKHWGLSEESVIQNTYRFSQKLIDITSEFVTQNPNQVKKVINGNTDESIFPLVQISSPEDKMISVMIESYLVNLPMNADVFLLGRYNFDKDYFKDKARFQMYYDNINQRQKVRYTEREDLDISFLTAHASKGLQAEYVIILNNLNSKNGFPSKVSNLEIVELLQGGKDNYEFAEERRLFYVAMTRAKKQVVLLTIDCRESVFVGELRQKYNEYMSFKKAYCPKCDGFLIKKVGENGPFLGCTNYYNVECTYTREINL